MAGSWITLGAGHLCPGSLCPSMHGHVLTTAFLQLFFMSPPLECQLLGDKNLNLFLLSHLDSPLGSAYVHLLTQYQELCWAKQLFSNWKMRSVGTRQVSAKKGELLNKGVKKLNGYPPEPWCSPLQKILQGMLLPGHLIIRQVSAHLKKSL